MNGKQVEKRLMELFRRKPSMTQQGRLVAHILNEIGVESDSTRKYSDIIQTALERLESKGVIKLERKGKVLNGYQVVKVEQPVTPVAAAVKSSHNATVVDLTQSMTEVTPQSDNEEDQMAENTSTACKYSRAEMATLVLSALQTKADSEGRIFVPSCVRLVAEELGISESDARAPLSSLLELGLRESPKGRNPDGKRPHWVSFEVTEVTEEMLVAPQVQEAKHVAEPDSDVEAKLVEIISGLESRLAECAASAEAADKLVEVVTELEATIASYEDLMLEANKALDAKGVEVSALCEERDALLSEARELRAQQLVKAAPSPAVASLLEKYGK